MPNPFPNILDNEELFNVIILAGTTSPGIVRLSGHNRVTEWDVKKGIGIKGATTTIKSIPPISFTATFELFRDIYTGVDAFADWPAFQDLIESSLTGTKPKALSIYHPDLDRNKITSVVRAEIGGMLYDGKGGATVAVKFQEYRPPQKKSGTVIAGPPAKNDPNAAAKAELDRLTNQYRATPWG